ncbi:N-acetylmuramoyl-L-alanine amidase-like protein/LysM domain-containing protein [Cytobacillus horneckiae]
MDYIYPGLGAPTTTYQNHIHEEIMKVVDFRDRGKKQANFHVLRETRMPAIFTENGFIDTVADANKLKQASFLQTIAQGHMNGLVRAFNLTPSGGSVYHTVVSGDTVYALSRRYGSTIQQIRNWNGVGAIYTIFTGQVIRVK